MDRFRLLSGLALVLAVVAVGMVAGGLSGGGGGEQSPGLGVGSGEGSGIGESDDFGLGGGRDVESDLPEWLTLGPVLLVIWLSGAVLAIFAVVFLWQASLREIIATVKESLVTVVGIAIAIGLLMAILMLFSGLFSGGGGGLMGESSAVSEEILGESTPTSSPSLFSGLVFVAGAALLGLVIFLFLPEGGVDSQVAAAASDDEEQDAESVTRRVRTVDGVEDPDATNEVYRAWTALRDEVGRPDRTESPDELRRRALEAGLDERAVSELTELFNATRYGERPVTSAEERRAREALDSLEGSGGQG